MFLVTGKTLHFVDVMEKALYGYVHFSCVLMMYVESDNCVSTCF